MNRRSALAVSGAGWARELSLDLFRMFAQGRDGGEVSRLVALDRRGRGEFDRAAGRLYRDSTWLRLRARSAMGC